MALRAPCRFVDDRKSAFEVFILVSKIREVPPALAVGSCLGWWPRSPLVNESLSNRWRWWLPFRRIDE